MNTQLIKTRLIETIGEKPTAFLQALRFVYLIKTKSKMDPEISLLPKLLKKGDTTIDVGANGADWTYWLHINVGSSGMVYAFEAEPYYATATDLAIKLLRLKGVRLFPYGLSDAEGEVALRVTDPKGLRLTGESHIDRNSSGENFGVKRVKVKPLDSFIDDLPGLARTKLIKCDVEGYELFVFRGAVEVLDSSRPFVILETGNYEMQGYSGKDIFDFFHRREYVPFSMIGDNALARTNTAMGHEKAISVNRVLVPEERLSNVQDRIRMVN
jgi:FkbM family methyltransferase